MVKLGSILSIRNILRASGIVAMSVGVPMLVVPALAIKFCLGKREDTQEPDKKALNLSMQALGAALTTSGTKSLLEPVSKQALGIALYEEAIFACYHLCNSLSGRWKDAKGRMVACNFFASLCSSLLILQALSLCCGDEPDDAEEKEESS